MSLVLADSERRSFEYDRHKMLSKTSPAGDVSAHRRGEYGRTYVQSHDDLGSTLAIMVLLGLIDAEPIQSALVVLSIALSFGRSILTSSPAWDRTVALEPVFGNAVRLAARLLPERVPAAIALARPDPALAR